MDPLVAITCNTLNILKKVVIKIDKYPVEESQSFSNKQISHLGLISLAGWLVRYDDSLTS